MQPRVFGFIIQATAPDVRMMTSAVVLVLALVTSALAFPFTSHGSAASGNKGFPQIHTELPQPQFVEKIGEGNSPVKHQTQPNTYEPKIEAAPINTYQPYQTSYSEHPVIQSVVPASQVGQILRPVIVPAEAITSGRVIIAGTESVQQKDFQNVNGAGENQQVYVPVQSQVVEPNQQPYYVQPVVVQTPVQQEINPAGQGYVPVQVQPYPEQLTREQTIPEYNYGQQNFETLGTHDTVPVEPNVQVYSVPQNVQQIVTPENQEYTSAQTYQQQVQQVEEKQGAYSQVTGYSQVGEQQVYGSKPTVVENVEKQVPQQNSQQQVSEAQQTVEKHGEHPQINAYTPSQYTQGHHQQAVEKQGQYPQYPTTFQTQAVQHQITQQGVEQGVYQQPIQRSESVEPVPQQQVYNVPPVEQVQPVEAYPTQQQVYSAPSVPEGQQVIQQQTYTPEKSSQTTAEQPQTYNVDPQQNVNYAGETAYNFGEKIPQNNSPVQTLSGVPQTHSASVQQPSVSSTP